MPSKFSAAALVLTLGIPLYSQAAPPRLDMDNQAQDVEISALAVPSVTFDESELFLEISAIRGAEAPDFHGTAFWYQGLLGVVYAKGMLEGGLSLFDISDPYDPVLVGQGNHIAQREGHSTGFLDSDDGVMAVLPASNGINIWDLSSLERPHVVKNVGLPGIIPSDYDFGAWWTAVQSPYIYVAGAFNGLYIIDASNLRRPQLVNQIRMGDGFRCGAVFAVGNLLVQSSSEGNRTRLYDISDPVNPQLIKEVEQTHSSYATYFNGGYLYAASDRGGMEIVDLRDPQAPATLSALSQSGGGAYVLVQDEFAHLGNSQKYYKIDISDPTNQVVVGSGEIVYNNDVDVDFISPLGNLAVLSDDHNLTQYNAGSRLMPHQAQPDTRAPVVNFQSPTQGLVNVPPTSRIGFTFSDQIMVESATSDSFVVRPVGSTSAVDGYYSVQEGIVNFTPAETLAEETEFEVLLMAGGIMDVAGNAMAETYRTTFSTGLLSINPPQANGGEDLVGEPGQVLVLDASDTKGGEGTVEYAWDPGDGTAQSPYSSSSSFNYTYAEEGHYTAIVSVRDERGQTSSDEVKVTIVQRPLSPTPYHSATLSPDYTGEVLWVVNPDHDTISAIDIRRQALIREIAVGDRPETLTTLDDDTIWVANRDSATLSAVDGRSYQVFRTVELPYGSRPYGITRSSDSQTVYVSLQGAGQVLAIDVGTGETLWSSDVGANPRGLALVEDELYVTRFISPTTHGEVLKLAADNGEWLDTMELQEDPGPDSDIGGRGVPNYLGQVIPSPDGNRLFIPGFKQNTSRGAARDGQALSFESTNRAMLSIINRNLGAEDFERRLDFDNRDQASALALSPLGDYAFVAIQGSQDVLIIDAFSGQDVATLEFVGEAPQGLWVSNDQHLFVQNFMGRELAVFDVSTFSDPDTLGRVASIRSVTKQELTHQELLGKRLFYNAADTRISRDSYISCAGCHIDGASDQRIWDFTDRGEGFRRTINLRGRAGTLHGPVHWTANFDEIQDFENDIRNAFEGSGLLDETIWQSGTHSSSLGDNKAGQSPELDALAAYTRTLSDADPSPYRNADGSLSEGALRGKSLFNSPELGCASCHSGPHFTDSQLTADPGDFLLHDVGTLSANSGQRLGGTLVGLDTPTLKGVWNNIAFLHDGSAATLDEVLGSRNANDLHGQTTQLSPSQRDDLVAYVQSIDSGSGSPVLVTSWPEDSDVFSEVDAITLRFSSRPNPDTIASSISLNTSGGSVATDISWSKNQVTLTPQSALGNGTYSVSIADSLLSLDGDPAQESSFTFEIEDLALVSDVRVHSGQSEDYELTDNLRQGALVYGDRDNRFVKIPAAYEGLLYLKTSHGDRWNDQHALVELDLSRPARVYVAFSRDHSRLPSWAADFTQTGEKLIINEVSAAPMSIYEGSFPAGTTFIGGPRNNGGADNNAMYVLFFDEAI